MAVLVSFENDEVKLESVYEDMMWDEAKQAFIEYYKLNEQDQKKVKTNVICSFYDGSCDKVCWLCDEDSEL